jgi:hypothetical protein
MGARAQVRIRSLGVESESGCPAVRPVHVRANLVFLPCEASVNATLLRDTCSNFLFLNYAGIFHDGSCC